MRLFRVLFALDVLGLLVLAYFFVDGMQYGADGDYLSAWAPLLLVPMVALAAAWALQAKGRTGTANLVLGLLAAPFVLYLLFIGLFVVLEPDMR